jgi:hypothetical protein
LGLINGKSGNRGINHRHELNCDVGMFLSLFENSSFPESEGMRTKPRLTTSSGRNTVPYVKLGPDPNDRFYKKPVDYKGGIGQLAKRGTMHIIDYTEQGGSGKILGSRKTRSKK